MKKESLEFTTIDEITTLFEINNWKIDIKNKNSLFNRIIHLHNSYDADKRKLLMKLLQNYKKVSLSEYEQDLIDLLEKACIKYKINSQEIYVMPIKQSHDIHKIKSADLITYLCNGTAMRYSDVLFKKKFISISNLEFLKSKLKQFEKRKLILLDDFIGSGRYAVEFTKELEKIGLTKNNIIVLTVFLHKKGADKMAQNGIEYEFGKIIDDGILTKLSKNELDLLEKIESDLNVNEDYKFGYDKSAALISLIRTPNNTLPMFWFGKHAPFPRI